MSFRPAQTLIGHLTDADDLLDLAHRIGRESIDNEGAIADELGRSPGGANLMVLQVASALGEISARDWEAFGAAGKGGYVGLLDVPAVRAATDVLEASALHSYSILHGLCETVLNDFYEYECTKRIELDRGMPIPFAARPCHTAMNRSVPFSQVTPFNKTLTSGHLLGGTSFRLWTRSSTDRLRVVLDFRRRKALDRVGWLGDPASGRLPLVATVHPLASSSDIEVMLDGPADDPISWFFVRPVAQNIAAIKEQLELAGAHDARAAVLPELCLDGPDDLRELVRDAARRRAEPATPSASSDDAVPTPEPPVGAIPDLVVAGSAHVERSIGEGAARSNESVTYLEGRELLRHQKVHPFATNELGPPHQKFAKKVPEAIAGGSRTLTVAAGRFTRFAVAICADLNDSDVPAVLAEAGVNFLLVPALTPSAGGFVGSTGWINLQAQGVTVVANGSAYLPPDLPEPFVAFAAAPRTASSSQEYPIEGGEAPGSRRTVGLLDLNEPLADAMRWLA